MVGCLRRRLSAENPKQRQEGARFALLTLSAVNLLNYADRYVPSAVKHMVQEELHLSDFQTSLPVTGMVGVYIVSAVFFGWLADKDVADRRLVLSSAVIFWSVATALAGLSQDVVQLVAFRSLVGVGEAAYMSIAPALISDFYPAAERNMAFTIFTLSIPPGVALGYGVGGALGDAFGWRHAFLACGAPGVVLALMLLACENPARGVNDVSEGESPKGLESDAGTGGRMLEDLSRIFSNPAYVMATAGLVANSFAVGAFADWFGELLHRRAGMTVGQAGLVLGGATSIGGIGGSLLGAKVAQMFEPRMKSAYFLVPSLFMIPGSLLCCLAINFVSFPKLACLCMILGQVFFFTFTAPISTVSISVIPVELRSRSAGLQIFCSHILGDVISPPMVGKVSDLTGSLQLALQLGWIALLFSSFWWGAGAVCLDPLPSFGGNERQEEQAGLSSLLCSTWEEAASNSDTSSTEMSSLGSEERTAESDTAL